MKKDLLTENEVIDAVISYFNTKGRTEVKKVVSRADASQKEHGVDLQIKLANAKGNGNKYFIEPKEISVPTERLCALRSTRTSGGQSLKSY